MKKSKFLKTLGFSCMAVFMGSLTILGGCATNLSTNNGNDLGANQTFTTTGLGLDPKNDPVIYTTESGLEIRYGGLDYGGTLTSGTLSGYHYITMGKYNNADINWIIIARDSNLTAARFVGDKTSYAYTSWKLNAKLLFQRYYMENIHETSTPAGSAINSSLSNSFIVDNEDWTVNISSVPLEQDNDLPNNCVFVVSQGILGSCQFSTGTVNYLNSTLKTKMEAYRTDLFTEQERSHIQLSSLICRTDQSSNTMVSFDAYLFPDGLGAQESSDLVLSRYWTESYCSCSSGYWARTATNSSSNGNTVAIRQSNGVGKVVSPTSTYGIRPLMVVSLA